MSENAAGRERRMSDLPVPRALRALSDASDPGERYRTLPDGYRAGQARFIIITGSVMSGLGKGIFSAGLARLLADRGFSTNLIKMDGYFNEDAGTLSPFRHGEVFVLDDGTECDMDIGTYERFVDKSFSEHNIFTNGRLARRINELERSGQFSGSDVQFYPHVTGEVIRFVRESSLAYTADITLVEIGGTVGDEENRSYISAMSELAYQEGERNVFFINLAWIIEASHLNEQKSKAAQHGTQMLMQMGVKPHMLVCRSENPVDRGVLRKLAQRLRLPERNVIDLHTQKSVYQVPPHLASQNVDELTLRFFDLPPRPRRTRVNLASYLQRLSSATERVVVGLAGKYLGPRDTYASILSALEHAGCACGVTVEVVDVSSDVIEHAGGRAARLDAAGTHLARLDGLIVPGGFGRRGWEGKIACITHARRSGLPLLGICYGFQAAMVEYARECCDMAAANTTENDAGTTDPVVCLLPEQYEIEGIGGTMRLGRHPVSLRAGSRVAALYGALQADERFRHRYELNPLYRKVFEDGGMVFSGWAPGQLIVQVAELPDHPFFVGVQFHPEFTSRPARPNPLFRGFVEAGIAHRRARHARAATGDAAPELSGAGGTEAEAGAAATAGAAVPAGASAAGGEVVVTGRAIPARAAAVAGGVASPQRAPA
jgi:CTP synthase